MAREYRIECNESIDRTRALEMLSSSPYFSRPTHPHQEGEAWLSVAAGPDYPDVRLFPRPFGFFLEITSLPKDLAESLTSWLGDLRTLGICSVVDNDTDEIVTVFR